MGDILTGKVLKVIDDYTIVINKGSNDGVTPGCRFLIYHLGEEIIDPDTGDGLGELEIVCGEGRPEHIQERITTIKSSKQTVRSTKKVIRRGSFSLMGDSTEEIYDPETTTLPFVGVDTDCLFKQV